ncbi:hypothetical protein BDR04DRAFT_361635 [Suillus decipiens]|nr:hypothetical protein BDR04DRAFT_361635 [Suillus decipiens]
MIRFQSQIFNNEFAILNLTLLIHIMTETRLQCEEHHRCIHSRLEKGGYGSMISILVYVKTERYRVLYPDQEESTATANEGNGGQHFTHLHPALWDVHFNKVHWNSKMVPFVCKYCDLSLQVQADLSIFNTTLP